MTTKRIIYKNDGGGVSVVVPAPRRVSELAEQGMTEGAAVHAIAGKSVPTGKPYKIVDVSEIPSDRSMRDAWTVDEAKLTDGVGE